ncbi:KUP/HAK/KT family potassium transporter [Caulobacter segnis]
MQLARLPRIEIKRTSETQAGQIFRARRNQFLLIGVLVLLFAFASSCKLASAGGIAVSSGVSSCPSTRCWPMSSFLGVEVEPVADGPAADPAGRAATACSSPANMLEDPLMAPGRHLVFGARAGADHVDLDPRGQHPHRQDPPRGQRPPDRPDGDPRAPAPRTARLARRSS